MQRTIIHNSTDVYDGGVISASMDSAYFF